MLNWVFGKRSGKRRRPGGRRKPPYGEAREIAASGSVEARRALAEHEDLEPEILYYFATDEAPEVRRTVAENTGTPLQADAILAHDVDEDVRAELARKIGRLVPELRPDENRRLVDMALEILDVLARDELPRVRAIVAEELKLATNVPHALIRRLAEDLEDIVRVPVIEYSPLLTEADLLDLIARGMRSRALVAVAKRRDLGSQLSDALVRTDDAPAVGALLGNASAKISAKAFDVIAEKAELNTEWHNAMVFRDDLPVRVVRRIAAFVNAALMETLIARNAQSKSLVEELRKTVRARIERGELPESPVIEAESGEVAIDPDEHRVKTDREKGVLDAARIDAALENRDFRYVRFALIELSGLPAKTVHQMLGTKSAKAAVAVVWKAGLPMKLAEKLQRDLVLVKRDQMLRAGPGGAFPLSDADIEWYLESFFA